MNKCNLISAYHTKCIRHALHRDDEDTDRNDGNGFFNHMCHDGCIFWFGRGEWKRKQSMTVFIKMELLGKIKSIFRRNILVSFTK